MEALLEMQNLTVRFMQRQGKKEFAAVDDINFRLYSGETLGIVGESGSGKSTVARAAARLLDVTSGKIFLKGEEITCVSGRKQREIYGTMQMVFQLPAESFDPRRTLKDGVGESPRNHGMTKRQAEAEALRLLEQCGLSAKFGERYPKEVSGGQCQRAAIARALAIRPELLILDEATSALDVTVQKQVLELLKELKASCHMSYLFISHDLAVVQNFCDRMLVMHGGRIVEEGTPDEVIRHPRSEYTKRLVEACDFSGFERAHAL